MRAQLLILFPSTAHAMAMEQRCQEKKVAGRLVPLPSHLMAGCGFAWKAEVEEEENLREFLDTESLGYEKILVHSFW